MALKQKITPEEHAALDPLLQKEYKKVNDAFLLDFDGATDLSRQVNAERLARERAENRANEVATQMTALQTQLDELTQSQANKDKDIPALNASWQAKLDAAIKKGKDTVDNLQRQFRQLLVHSKAEALAAEISDSPKLLLPHIEAMLDVDFSGDMPTTRVLDAERKPSALTMDDLKKSFVDNQDFAAIIKGSGSSGGGAGHGRIPSGGGASKPLKDMTEAERVTLAKHNPEQFKQKATAEGFGRFAN